MMSVNNSSFHIKDSSNWGRYITADRHYNIGDIILDEAPLLSGPLGIREALDCETENDVVSISYCVGCFKVLDEVTKSCPDCLWEVCCEECSEESFHKRYECALFKKNQILPNNKPALRRLNIIRACLMYKDSENSSGWQNFTTLASELDKQTDRQFKAVVENEIINATKFMNDVCKLAVDSSTVGKILRTFIVNAFASVGKDENGSLYEVKLLYKTGSLFCHSCSPNAEWIILPSPQNGIKRWNIRIYAKKNISCNESITIPYVQDFLTSDTATRQQILLENYHFYCQCELCVDKTEFYFYTSALKCCCGDTHLLADDPSDPHSPWTCGICGKCTDSLVAKGHVKNYESSLRAINFEYSRKWESCLDKLINSSDSRNLTSNHRAVIRTIYFWLNIQTFNDLLEHTMESQLKFIKILERATKCLQMCRMFGTFLSIVSVELVFAYSIASFYFKTRNLQSIQYDNYSPQERRQILSAIHAHMKIAVQIIEWNPYKMSYRPLRDKALSRFKFWQSQLETLKDVHETVVKIEGVEIQSKGFLGNETTNMLDPAQMFPCPLNEMPSKDSESQSSSVLRSVVVKSVSDSELIASKPDVSMLLQYDYYFNN